MHSLLAKGRLLYTHDETIAALCARLHEIGERDTQLQLFAAATHALPSIDKAHKWFVTRGDLDYTALWILYAATPLARIEVMGARLLADREVIPQAMKLNPAFFQTVYTGPAQREEDAARTCRPRWTRSTATWRSARPRCSARPRSPARGGRSALGHRDRGPLQAQLQCGRGDHGVRVPGRPGLIGKASTPVQLTKRSNVVVQELAFVHLGEAPDEF